MKPKTKSTNPGKQNSILIRTENLDKIYPLGLSTLKALNQIDLSVTKGEFLGLVGPSGSGKTTLLNIIGSLDAPTSGSAEVLGQRIESLSHKEAARLRNNHIGFIFQTFNLLPVYTVFENVEFPLLLLGMDASRRKKLVMDALEWVGLAERADSKPAQLSGGQSQRVAIARAIVKKPEIVLADEPTANLDAENSHHIMKTMVQLNKELETTFVFATHDEKVIGYLRRKITLVDGRIEKDEKQSRHVRQTMFILKLAFRNILGAGLRTWLNVVALSFSFVAIIFLQGIYTGMNDQVERATIDAFYGGGQFWQKSYDPYDPLTLADAHAAIPAELEALVKNDQATPILIRQATIYPEGRFRTILLKGIDPRPEGSVDSFIPSERRSRDHTGSHRQQDGEKRPDYTKGTSSRFNGAMFTGRSMQGTSGSSR